MTAWDPNQYNQFANEREQPFWDLAALIEPVSAPTVADLGCGDGRLTAALGARLGARVITGVDSSSAMLADTAAHSSTSVRFEPGDLGEWRGHDVDIVFANASLHWAPDHARVLARWADALTPDGQLAVQMPSNADHASHWVARALADEWLGGDAPPDPVDANVRKPEEYAELLDDLGFAHQHVRLQVYGHHLATTADVVEWVKGSSLTRFKRILEPADYDAFVDEYRRRLIHELGERAPYFYTFKRILLWCRHSAAT